MPLFPSLEHTMYLIETAYYLPSEGLFKFYNGQAYLGAIASLLLAHCNKVNISIASYNLLLFLIACNSYAYTIL